MIKKISYELALSWFSLLTSNLFKDNFTTLSDRLRLNFIKKKRLTMVDGEDERAQNNKEDP